MLDGVLVIDKPPRLTSHDVVAAARRALNVSRIGHTGTLDPMATGVLPLACGRATRLVQFLIASDKEYEAEIRLGLTTDTYDITGREIARNDARPSHDAIVAALATLRGGHRQAPPPFSAKRVAGKRAYDLARAEKAVQPEPADVTLHEVEILAHGEESIAVKLTCSSGFYVRSLAHDLGVLLGTGACLQALRRTRSGEFILRDALTMDVLMDGAIAPHRAVPLERLLPGFPSATLTTKGAEWVAHGRLIGVSEVSGPLPEKVPWVRLLSPEGRLVALGRPSGTGGSLHPAVVLN